MVLLLIILSEGKKYLDFAAGIAVNALGYHYPGYDEALKAQIDKLTHISNLYYNEPMSEAGEKLVKASGSTFVVHDEVFDRTVIIQADNFAVLPADIDDRFREMEFDSVTNL